MSEDKIVSRDFHFLLQSKKIFKDLLPKHSEKRETAKNIRLKLICDIYKIERYHLYITLTFYISNRFYINSHHVASRLKFY